MMRVSRHGREPIGRGLGGQTCGRRLTETVLVACSGRLTRRETSACQVRLAGQPHAHDGAAVGVIGRIDLSSVLLDDAADDREAEARAARAAAEERLEEVREVCSGEAGAGRR